MKELTSDDCYTPFYAVEPILKYLPKDKIIWCGFDEEWSAFCTLLTERGYKVVHSSLEEGKDFFNYEPKEWDIFISNPPFSKQDKILERLFSFNKPFALLLPIKSLQGKARYKLFKQSIQLMFFDGRVNYHTRGNLENYTPRNHFASGYFCRNLLPNNLIPEELTEYKRPLINSHKEDTI